MREGKRFSYQLHFKLYSSRLNCYAIYVKMQIIVPSWVTKIKIRRKHINLITFDQTYFLNVVIFHKMNAYNLIKLSGRGGLVGL